MRVACLERLATALSGYAGLSATVRAEGLAPCLAVRNIAVPFMSETISVGPSDDGLTFMWSWGAPIGDASDPDAAAQAVAYVLSADGARLSR